MFFSHIFHNCTAPRSFRWKADFLEAAEGDVQHADVMAAFLQWDRNGSLDNAVSGVQ